MVDYSKGKIYKIWDNLYTICYVGSTTQPLSKRMVKHRCDYKRYLQKKRRDPISVFKIFNEFGIGNCKIELVEDFPCESKEELNAREGQIQKECECVNKLIAGRTQKQRYEENKDEFLKNMKEYRDRNKGNPLFKETKQQSQHKYYEKNKDKLLEKMKCECGGQFITWSLNRHLQSKLHQQYMTENLIN